MNIWKLKRAFKEFKEKGNLDYAITNADNYGDCQSCVNYSLCVEFGEDSKGIWTKNWFKGMNSYYTNWKDTENVYIAHDLTEEQGKLFIGIMTNNGYDIEPKEYNSYKCFKIEEIEV